MATLIKADGTITEVQPESGTHFSLRELQGFVGGYIEIIPVGRQLYIMNEEGKLNNLPLNVAATHRAHGFLMDGDYLVGDVLICDEDEVD